MTDPLADALRRLRPSPGPTPESAAFAAGSLAASRRLRRRYVPIIVVLATLVAAGWGVALWPDSRPLPPPTTVPVPVLIPETPPEPAAFYPWQARLDRLADPPVVRPDATPTLPPFPLEDLS